MLPPALAFILSHEVVIGTAVVGGLASLLAIGLQARRSADPRWAARVNRIAYVFMGISVVLFLTRGLLLPPTS